MHVACAAAGVDCVGLVAQALAAANPHVLYADAVVCGAAAADTAAAAFAAASGTFCFLLLLLLLLQVYLACLCVPGCYRAVCSRS